MREKILRIFQNKNIFVTILIVLLFVISFSFAMYNIVLEGINQNKITTGKITFSYKEPMESLNLLTYNPLSDEEGKKQSNYYEFSVKATSDKEEIIDYVIYLQKEEVNKSFLESDLKIYLTKVVDGVEEEVFAPKLLSDLVEYNDVSDTKALYGTNITFTNDNLDDKVDTYRLRIWLDEYFNFNDYIEETANNGTLNIKLEQYEYKFKVNIATGVLSTKVLVTGENFNLLVPDTATKVVFTDITSPSGATLIDVSQQQDESVMAWLDNETFYVSSMQSGVKIFANKDSAAMFYDLDFLTSIDLSMLDTSKVTDMSGMFSGCNSLTTLDLSGFDTSNVTYMELMFENCKSLTELDLSSFDTSKVISMGGMFEMLDPEGSSSLTTLDLSSFDTSNVTDMTSMFYGCDNLIELDLSNFDTSKVTYMSAMFEKCFNLTTLNVSSFDTSNVTNMEWMFGNCFELTELNISNFDTSNVTNMEYMFGNCNELSLDCSDWNVSKVTRYDEFNVNAPGVIAPTWVN